MINSLEYFCLQTECEYKILWMNGLTRLEYDCDILVVTIVTILEQNQYI